MYRSLEQHDVVQKSLRRLKAMGLNVRVYSDNPNEVYLFIDLESVTKLIDKHITYPARKVYMEDKYIVVYLWRK